MSSYTLQKHVVVYFQEKILYQPYSSVLLPRSPSRKYSVIISRGFTFSPLFLYIFNQSLWTEPQYETVLPFTLANVFIRSFHRYRRIYRRLTLKRSKIRETSKRNIIVILYVTF